MSFPFSAFRFLWLLELIIVSLILLCHCKRVRMVSVAFTGKETALRSFLEGGLVGAQSLSLVFSYPPRAGGLPCILLSEVERRLAGQRCCKQLDTVAPLPQRGCSLYTTMPPFL